MCEKKGKAREGGRVESPWCAAEDPDERFRGGCGEKGGDLVLRDDLVPLRAGDAVLFFARGLPRGILPTVTAIVGPSGSVRANRVIRLNAVDEREGESP
jgi:hypothetical protein